MPGEKLITDVVRRALLSKTNRGEKLGDATLLNGEVNKTDKERTEKIEKAEKKQNTA